MSEEKTVETEMAEPTEVDEPVVVKSAKRTVRAKEPEIRDPNDAILELRRENERLRKTLEEASEAKAQEMAEQRIKEAEERAKAEAQKLLDDRLKEMDRQAKNRVMKAELKAQATRAGVVDFDDLYEILKRDALSKVQFSDDGDVINAGELIAELKQAKPYLFTGVSTSSATVPPEAAKPSGKPEKVALKMSRAEYEASKLKLFHHA